MDFFESFATVSQAPEPTFRLCGSETEGRVRDHLTHLGSHKPMAPDGLQLQALMELADVFARPPSITSKGHGKEVGSRCLGKGKYRTYLQKMQGECGETAAQAVSPNFLEFRSRKSHKGEQPEQS